MPPLKFFDFESFDRPDPLEEELKSQFDYYSSLADRSTAGLQVASVTHLPQLVGGLLADILANPQDGLRVFGG